MSPSPVPTTDSAMYRTMHRQPTDLQRLLSSGWEQARQAAQLLQHAERMLITGIGTSYHAALAGSWLFRAAGLDARAALSFDVATYPDQFVIRPTDAVIAMAHTGIKTYSRFALQRAVEAGATVLSVGSLTAEHPGSQLVLRTVERETSAAYTASHLAAMTVLAQVATELGESRGAAGIIGFRDTLMALPDQVAGILRRESEIEPVARIAATRRIYAAGAGPNEATATELVIKAREAAYAHVDGLAAEQFLHGPIVAVNAGDLAVMVHVPGAAAQRVAEIATVLHGMGALLWIVGQPIPAVADATVFALPETPEMLSPLVAVVPMQILAYQIAVTKKINPDTFRRDDPVYKEAFARLTL